MCGIVGYTGAQAAAPILLEGLKKLEYRGYDSAGIAVMNNDAISVNKVTGRIANLCEKTGDGANVSGFTGIGHTRWATHGAPTEENAHPHLSIDGRFAIVHNGIIENYITLREELIRDGYIFESETDTEVIVHLLELYYKGNVREAQKSWHFRSGITKRFYPLRMIFSSFRMKMHCLHRRSRSSHCSCLLIMSPKKMAAILINRKISQSL